MAQVEQSTATIAPAATQPQTSADHVVNVGTRKSILARVQTDIVVDQLKKLWPEREYVIHAISTMGDNNQVTALYDFGAKSLWTYELEAMLIAGEVDFIVHSLKDIPTQVPPSTTIGCILARGDPRDALVLHPSLPPDTTLSKLPPGSTIGTSSVRRVAQLARLYPHLTFQSVRGNVHTRLSKLDAADSPYSALILAAAGLLRLDLGARISAYLSSTSPGGAPLSADEAEFARNTGALRGMLHAVGQGAIGVQTREGDARVDALLAPIADKPTTLACLAERSLMRTLEGGCSVPIGVETQWAAPESEMMYAMGPTGRREDMLTMRAIVVSVDGKRSAECVVTEAVVDKDMADEFGRTVAKALIDKGAANILSEINVDRGVVDNQTDNA